MSGWFLERQALKPLVAHIMLGDISYHKATLQSEGKHSFIHEAQERNEIHQLNALVDDNKRNGDSENVAHLKAQDAFLPLYRNDLRKVLLEYLQWMRAMKKDNTFQKVIEIQKDLKDTDGFDWLESTELAIDKRKFLLNRLFVKQPIPEDEDQTYCVLL